MLAHERPDDDFPFLPGLYPSLWPWLLVILLGVEWAINPVCRRIWRKARAAAIGAFVFGLFIAIIPIIDFVTYHYGIGMPIIPVPVLILLYEGWFPNLLGWIALHLFPVAYGVWAYRKFYMRDAMLRNVPLSPAARFYSFLAPALLMLTLFFAPLLLSRTIVPMLDWYDITAFDDLMYSPVAAVFEMAFAAVGMIFKIVMYYLFVITILLRTMLLDRVTGRRNGHGWGFILAPMVVYLSIVAIVMFLAWLVTIFVFSFVWMLLYQLFGELPVELHYLYESYRAMATKFLMMMAVYVYFRQLWPGDTRLAFLEMFEAPDADE